MLRANIIIQARINSSRLPAKTLIRLPCGNTMIEAVVFRLKFIERRLNASFNLVVACPETDEPIFSDIFKETDVTVCSGSEENVAARYLSTLQFMEANECIRVTGDNPYICEDFFKFCLEKSLSMQNGKCISFYGKKLLPNGTIASCISKKFLENVVDSRCKIAHEHMVISEDQTIIGNILEEDIPAEFTWPTGRFCLDTVEDLYFIYDNYNILNNVRTIRDLKSQLPTRIGDFSY